ncbi:MAG TPA: HTH domain-containing protein, partial [Atopostipes sp.]|nr:HTH domain-containing protein [Atopostipes sp.]
MVYFTNREIKILRLMTQKSEGVSMEELMRTLDVSRRTVYRELKMLEGTAKSLNLQLEKEGKLHRLRGADKAFSNLVHQLDAPVPIEWVDVEKRQNALLSTIALKAEKTFSTTELATLFNVSQTTIQQDITRLNEILLKYNIQIERTEDQKLYLSGNEVYIRLYLSQILSNDINEFDVLQVLNGHELMDIETESQYLLSLVDTSILRMAYDAVASEQPDIFSQIADKILLNILLTVTISLVRLEKNNRIMNLHSVDHDQLFPYMQQILSIVKVFDSEYKQLLNTTELSFFAMQIRGVNV